MEIDAKEDGTLEFSKVYSPIRIIGDKKEVLTIAIRDGGFELSYDEHIIKLRKGEIHFLGNVNIGEEEQ